MLLQEILRVVRPGCPVLIFVWALEQSKFTKRNFDRTQQDVFVPWTLSSAKVNQEETSTDDTSKKVYQR